MNLSTPRTVHEPLSTALEMAIASKEPLFVPSAIYTDDRGWSLMNQMQGVLRPEGQINFSVQYPGTVKAWHRHARQTDFWMCLTGHLKVGVHRQDDKQSWALVIGEKRPGIVVIPPPLWHGAATVGPESAGLLYYVTHSYDARNPDEERMGFDGVQGFPWQVVHR